MISESSERWRVHRIKTHTHTVEQTLLVVLGGSSSSSSCPALESTSAEQEDGRPASGEIEDMSAEDSDVSKESSEGGGVWRPFNIGACSLLKTS